MLAASLASLFFFSKLGDRRLGLQQGAAHEYQGDAEVDD
jgi:hypothetical protein